MAHRFYHGRTGRVWNVTPRAVGVEINKRVRGRIMTKRLTLRMEHVVQSKCRQGHLARVAENDKIRNSTDKKDAKPLKRVVPAGRPGAIIKVGNKPASTMHPLPYELLC